MSSQGRTTIETLEKTRYLNPLKKTMQHQQQRHYLDSNNEDQTLGERLVEIHANFAPGATRPEEGEEERRSPATRSLRGNWADIERQREHDRYEDYLDEQDSEKLPNAFDLGWKGNLRHLFGPNPWLWTLPVCNTTGDGWLWEASPKWLAASEQVAREREAQARIQKSREEEVQRFQNGDPEGYGRQSRAPPRTSSRQPSVPPPLMGADKAEKVLGKSNEQYSDGMGNGTMLRTLDRRKDGEVREGEEGELDYDTSSDEETDVKTFLSRDASRSQGSKSRSRQEQTENWNDVPTEFLTAPRPAGRDTARVGERGRGRGRDEGWQDWGQS